MVARQHPGEAMAEWFVEGFLDRLTDPHDGASMRVLEHAVFYVVGIASSPDRSLLYRTLQAAEVVSYHNDSVSWSILAYSTALDCFAAACMHVESGMHVISGMQLVNLNLWHISHRYFLWKGAISFTPTSQIRLS